MGEAPGEMGEMPSEGEKTRAISTAQMGEKAGVVHSRQSSIRVCRSRWNSKRKAVTLRPALIALQEISQPSFSVSSLTAGSMIHRRRSLKFVVWLVFASMAVAKASTETCFQPVSLYCINISKSRHE